MVVQHQLVVQHQPPTNNKPWLVVGGVEQPWLVVGGWWHIQRPSQTRPRAASTDVVISCAAPRHTWPSESAGAPAQHALLCVSLQPNLSATGPWLSSNGTMADPWFKRLVNHH